MAEVKSRGYSIETQSTGGASKQEKNQEVLGVQPRTDSGTPSIPQGGGIEVVTRNFGTTVRARKPIGRVDAIGDHINAVYGLPPHDLALILQNRGKPATELR